MQEIQLSNFKKNIHAVIDAIVNSQQPVLISDNGKHLVKIVPHSKPVKKSWIGCMKSKGRIVGDIMSPAESPDKWEVLSE